MRKGIVVYTEVSKMRAEGSRKIQLGDAASKTMRAAPLLRVVRVLRIVSVCIFVT